MFGFGIWEAILILALVVLFFGGKKIPQVARGLGSAIRNFKGELGDGDGEGNSSTEELPGEDPRARGVPGEDERPER